MAQNWAICVGISGYKWMPPLKYAERDALAMTAFFKSANFQTVYTFTDSSPPIEDASRAYDSSPTFGTLDGFLSERFRQPFLKPGDNLWFFFSGHGLSDRLMAIDSNPNGHSSSGIAINYVAERLRGCGATNVILLLDACRSEHSAKDGALPELHEPGVIVLSSCSWGEQSYEIDTLGQGSFTYALRESLQLTGEKNCATVERLEKRVRARVRALNQQHHKPIQTPCAQVEPSDKKYLILLPGQATDRDIERYKMFAYRAESRGALVEAQSYWEMLWEIAPGYQEVKEGFRNIVLKLAGHEGAAVESVVPVSDAGNKTSTVQVPSKPRGRPHFQTPDSPTEKITQVELKSVKGADYCKLQDLLKQQAWKEADQETRRLMLEVGDRQEQGWLRVEDIKQFPCKREFRLSETIAFLKTLKSRCQTRLSGVQPPDTSR
ncbi:MAG: caspase family protein [Cyanobacteria bacterium P01_G01_bin.54]